MVSKISDSLSEGFSKLSHLIGHRAVGPVEFFSEHPEPLTEPVDVRDDFLYSDLTHLKRTEDEPSVRQASLRANVTSKKPSRLRGDQRKISVLFVWSHSGRSVPGRSARAGRRG